MRGVRAPLIETLSMPRPLSKPPTHTKVLRAGEAPSVWPVLKCADLAGEGPEGPAAVAEAAWSSPAGAAASGTQAARDVECGAGRPPGVLGLVDRVHSHPGGLNTPRPQQHTRWTAPSI